METNPRLRRRQTLLEFTLISLIVKPTALAKLELIIRLLTETGNCGGQLPLIPCSLRSCVIRGYSYWSPDGDLLCAYNQAITILDLKVFAIIYADFM